MASSTMTSTIFLRGAPDAGEDVRVQSSWSKRPAILVNLNEHVLLQLQQCCQQGKVVQFLGGVAPKLRYGSKTLNLNVRPETFRHEIYEANKARTGSLDFSTLVSYEAHVKPTEQKSESSAAGADAALAALKESLASMAQQKEARKVTISNSVIPNTKNGSLQSHRHSSSLLQRPSFNSSSSTPRSVAAPTSAPQTDSQNAAVEKGMRTALIHLLATAPTTERELHSKTRVPTPQLSSILPKIAEKTGSQWELSSKSFKELDPWTFRYPSEKQRQAAIDNAIRAFDRIRVPKDDRLWQTLLPKEDRGTGKVLSRLHLGVERREQTGTPALSPLPAQNTMEGTETETATPKLGPASTRRNGAVATGRSAAGISIEKRLREATKKQVQDKKKKDKDKEAVTSDRESKPRVTKPRPTVTKRVVAPKRVSEKIKSAELVHDSDEDEEGEITDSKPARKHETPLADSHRLGTRPKTSTMPGKGGWTPNARCRLNREPRLLQQ
ncbi:hypothetical protein AAFC00_000079 [Neodothiora populina]|uniref:E3 ubiquitin-protein ligase n=1 Tax=Neodothiora populina TaxID=2781224 RepID=A0ABR3P1B7_9PEZI